jgi:hypothetical protein
MIDWSIEAFDNETEDLAWDLLLSGTEKEDLERALDMSMPTPDSYPITVEQVVTAVRASSPDLSLDDLDLDAERFSFFLTATKRG